MAFEVGSDVESMCRICGDVWHVIVAKVGEKITKVECKQCGKQHRFKATGEAPAEVAPTRRRVTSDAPAGRPRSKPESSVPVHDPDKPTRPYAMQERYENGEQIQHKKFGAGVVCGVEDSKIRVNFAQGIKVLLHRKGS